MTGRSHLDRRLDASTAADCLATRALQQPRGHVPLIDHLLASSKIRHAVWKFWYPFLTRRLRDEDVVFLNYAYEENPPLNIPLTESEEVNRACTQLYHHVAAPGDLRGRDVLEVSSGHGGGAAYLSRRLGPRRYVGIDLNPAAVAYCRRRHARAGLEFQTGDAGALPFPDESFDVVINVEASHCYPSFPRFLAEVARVLRPAGTFLYADFRFRSGIAEWESAFRESALIVSAWREINAEVQRGLDTNAERSMRLIVRRLPPWLHNLGRDFAGIPGSRVYTAIANGDVSYRSCVAMKPADRADLRPAPTLSK